MPDLFEDVDTRAEPADQQPPEVTQPGLVEKVKWRWGTLSRGGKAGVLILVGFGLLAAWGALSGGEAKPDAASTPTTAAKSAATAAPTTTQPVRHLVVVARDRPVGDPLRGLPDLHYMVYAYAGGDADSFSNVVRTLIGAGASMCDLFFGVDAKGWRVVPRTADMAYPNDYFPVRVFTSAPCPVPVGNPDPQNFITSATTIPAS